MTVTTRGFTIDTSLELVTEECCTCGVTFAMPASFQKQCINNPGINVGKPFYCPAGHQQWYTGKSPEQKLRHAQKLLEFADSRERALRDQKDATERSNRALKGVITKTKRRVGNGVCPCCNRTFKDLARHMAGQHPEYAEGAAT